ncbi:MAG: hypothetical protein ACI857_002731 [Arenicella sp.]|jgi:hypothetical protein
MDINFEGAVIGNLRAFENYFFGATVSQRQFEELHDPKYPVSADLQSVQFNAISSFELKKIKFVHCYNVHKVQSKSSR